MDIAAKIQAARIIAGWSKGRLARESGLSPAYIGQLEAGQKQPSVKSLGRICAALGISLPAFLADPTPDASSDLLRESPAEYRTDDLASDLRGILDAARRISPRQRKLLLEIVEEWTAPKTLNVTKT